MSEQVVDGLLVGGEMGGNVHVVQYVGRVDGHNRRFNGEKRRRPVDAFAAASLPRTALYNCVATTLTAQSPTFGGDKPASFSSRRSSTLLEDVKGKLATKTN